MDQLLSNITVEDENILNVGLPKWPAMVVVGENVTHFQAAEILLRTDYHFPDFSYAGNNKHHRNELMKLVGAGDSDEMDWRELMDKMTEFRTRVKKVDLEYLNNDQIMSSWIGGPHGWCSWEGVIFSNTFNIGKWPSVESVANDWGRIAEAFPFLNLRSQLYSGESSEYHKEPVIDFTVSNGRVHVNRPTKSLFNTDEPTMDLHSLINGRGEIGISIEKLMLKIQAVYGEIPQL